MKKKVLMSSIVTIVLCLTLIAGSTFALFTDKNEINIAVTSGEVNLTAKLDGLTISSVRPATVAEKNAGSNLIEDEFGGLYVYEDHADGIFANGGTAELNAEGNTLSLNRVTPGDKVAFDIVGTNESDVTIQYRYIIECVGETKLMSGLLVTIGENTYPILEKFTSKWMTLEAPVSEDDKALDPVHVVIELPVKAGNDYQMQATAIKITVEAVQGNADVYGSEDRVDYLDGYTLDLGGETLDVSVANHGSIALENGTIDIGDVGFQNYGSAELTDIVIDAGTPGYVAYGYGIIGQAGSETILNNVTLESKNGAIGALNGAYVEVNGGTVEVDSLSTSARYHVYAVGEGTKVVINDGNFDFNKTQNQKRAYAYVGEGSATSRTSKQMVMVHRGVVGSGALKPLSLTFRANRAVDTSMTRPSRLMHSSSRVVSKGCSSALAQRQVTQRAAWRGSERAAVLGQSVRWMLTP